jgi:RNA-binding protein involved in rRNA processing
LRKLGKVLHYSKVSKRLIVKSKEADPVRGYVADKTGYIIGKVDEVFGPTGEPYFAIKPYSKIEPTKYLGEEVFLVPYSEQKGETRKGSRKASLRAGRKSSR